MNENAHIREFLHYYCGLPKEPQYAVLLTGLWGSGKTWFIKDFIESHLPHPERVLYLSLYGVQSIDDIESEFFRLQHPILGSKPARILGRLARGVLKASINFDLDGDGKADGNLSGSSPSEKILESVTLDAGCILVLDDLERCSIPIADLLGYVNQFIEHGGVKAILIANEEELRTHVNYGRIKEKLIGRTFGIIPEVRSALEHFAADLPNENARKVVQNNYELIERVYECSEYKNLRLVRYALWDFDRLLQQLELATFRSEQLLVDLLALFLSYSFEIHSGAITPEQIAKIQDTWSGFFGKNKNEPDPNQQFHDIRKKYSSLQLYTSLVSVSTWKAIFSTGSIPRAELNESLLKSKYFKDDNQPNWVKLWYGMDLSDDDFAAVLKSVEAEWQERHYRQQGEVVHVTGLFVRLAKNGILKESVDDVIKSAKEYIDYLLGSGEITVLFSNARPLPFERDAYAGLGFASLEEAEFQSFLEYIHEQRKAAYEQSLPAQAASLLELVGKDTNLFYRRIVLNNHSDNTYYQTPILHLIQPDSFVRRFLTASPEDRKIVAYAFKERYAFQQFNTNLQPELDWLREIATQLRSEIQTRAGKISSLSLSWIVDPYISEAISNLEEVNSLDA